MRTKNQYAIMATALFATTNSAWAESKWLESGRLDTSEIKVLCERVSDVRQLARMQMISVGNERWRRLSRQELVIEAAMMGLKNFLRGDRLKERPDGREARFHVSFV